jgi:hypothetical protein
MHNTDFSFPSLSMSVWSGKVRWPRPAAVITAFVTSMNPYPLLELTLIDRKREDLKIVIEPKLQSRKKPDLG